MRLDDTIAAVATPLLASGLGVIRVSGSKSIPIVSSLFKGSSLKKTDSHKEKRLIYSKKKWVSL